MWDILRPKCVDDIFPDCERIQRYDQLGWVGVLLFAVSQHSLAGDRSPASDSLFTIQWRSMERIDILLLCENFQCVYQGENREH